MASTRIAYHGTSLENALKIQDEGLKPSERRNLKFGRGIYLSPNVGLAYRYAKRDEITGGVIVAVEYCALNPKIYYINYQEIPSNERNLNRYDTIFLENGNEGEKEIIIKSPTQIKSTKILTVCDTNKFSLNTKYILDNNRLINPIEELHKKEEENQMLKEKNNNLQEEKNSLQEINIILHDENINLQEELTIKNEELKNEKYKLNFLNNCLLNFLRWIPNSYQNSNFINNISSAIRTMERYSDPDDLVRYLNTITRTGMIEDSIHNDEVIYDSVRPSLFRHINERRNRNIEYGDNRLNPNISERRNRNIEFGYNRRIPISERRNNNSRRIFNLVR